MLDLGRSINGLRKISFFLFLLPVIGLLGSLIFNNILTEFKFKPGQTYKSIKISELSLNHNLIISCDKKNNFCENQQNFVFLKSLDTCSINRLDEKFIVNKTEYTGTEYYNEFFTIDDKGKLKSKKTLLNKDKIDHIFYKTDNLKKDCIINSKFFKFYKIFPLPFEFINNLRANSKYSSPTSVAVYPFLYGETSISNIVKRFPVNYFFKPLLYFSSFLMILYWLRYQKIFNLIVENKKIYLFFIFGTLSGIFLFLHVLFLGMNLDFENFQKLRRFIISMFILCELLAQFFLIQKIISFRDFIFRYTYKKIVNIKIIFVSIIVLISLILILILAFYNIPDQIDNFLEWNYFLILLFFYLISSIMWKKINP